MPRRWMAVLVVLIVLFAVTTLWAVTVQGILEVPQGVPEHFEAGAGNGLLVLRLSLSVACAFCLVASAFFSRNRATRILLFLGGPLVLATFVMSATTLERSAPGYSEAAFQSLVTSHLRGDRLAQGDITAVLGEPLLVFHRQPDSTTWCYTYMPSGGFGWRKRVIEFDKREGVTAVWSLDEP